MLGGNSLGEWLKPLIIGKSANPRAFKGIDMSPHNVMYRANKTAYLTKSLFNEYLTSLNEELVENDRKILILVDNFSGHVVDSKSNIKLVYLPPNCTSLIQPLDMGIINSFKAKFKQKLNNFQIYWALNHNLDHLNIVKKVNMLNVVLWVESSLKNISDITIKKCWEITGLFEDNVEEGQIILKTEEDFEPVEDDCAFFEDLISINNMKFNSLNLL